MGIVGPRMPSWPQHAERVDEVCYDFPELRLVMMHGTEPWTALAVKLMLKWPGLHYMTSAFAPKHYPKDIIDYANTRGADKIMYCGYPAGLTYERQFRELPNVPFKDHVWPKFLRENALRVFRIQEAIACHTRSERLDRLSGRAVVSCRSTGRTRRPSCRPTSPSSNGERSGSDPGPLLGCQSSRSSSSPQSHRVPPR